jgi:hypothetical protein
MMMDENVPAPKRRLNAHGRILRRARHLGASARAFAYDEIAREEGLPRGRGRRKKKMT